jgi:hypothetical protein
MKDIVEIKMLEKIFFLVVIQITLSGCIPKAAFQPSPPLYTMWKKNGVTHSEIKHAMHECGYKNPYAPVKGETREDWAKQQICMLSEGYSIDSETGYKGTCYGKNWHTIPACKEYRNKNP